MKAKLQWVFRSSMWTLNLGPFEMASFSDGTSMGLVSVQQDHLASLKKTVEELVTAKLKEMSGL